MEPTPAPNSQTVPTVNDVVLVPAGTPKPTMPKMPFVVGGVICFLVLGLIGAIGVAAYTQIKLPGVSPEMRVKLTTLVYKVPLLPKTPRQILTVASATDAALTSYTADFSFSAKMGGAAITAGAVDLNLKGPLDFSNPQDPKFDIMATAQVNYAGTDLKLAGKVRGVEKIVYFKIDEVPVATIDNLLKQFLGFSVMSMYSQGGDFPTLSSEEVANKLQPVYANWIKYDTRGLDTEARRAMQQNSQSQSIIDTSRRRVQNILMDEVVIPEVKLIGTEKIGDAQTYHLQVRPSKEVMKRITGEVYSQSGSNGAKGAVDNFVSAADAVTVDAWFGTADALPRKISAQLNLNLGTLMGSTGPTSVNAVLSSLGTGSVNLSWVLSLSNIGQTVKVAVPKPVVDPGGYWQMATAAMKSPEQVAWEEQQSQYAKDFAEMSAGLLKQYVDTGAYPATLSTIFGDKYAAYKYRQTKSGQGYVLYVVMPNGGSYYGVTSGSSYLHKLTDLDFK